MVSFCFPFYNVCVRKQWGIRYVILGEDSHTSGPSSIAIRMEYLFAFVGVGQKVSFLFLLLVLLKEMRMRG